LLFLSRFASRARFFYENLQPYRQKSDFGVLKLQEKPETINWADVVAPTSDLPLACSGIGSRQK
jgi:hypothetical protein